MDIYSTHSSISSYRIIAHNEVNAPKGPVYYDSTNHWKILTQCYGSSWSKVLPYCVVNTMLMLILSILQELNIIQNWGITSIGHTFASMIISFLLVSRINTALGRYATSRAHIGTMYKQTRELTQTMSCMSLYQQSKNTDNQSKEWRNEMAYRAMVMLRTAVALVRYNKDHHATWEVPELTGKERDYVTPNTNWSIHAQCIRTRRSDSMRVPIRLAYMLRETICSQSSRLEGPLGIQQELKLMSIVDTFINGYYGIRQFITTPVPFPLIQMTRTIVMAYIFTVPFVLLNEQPHHEEKAWHLILEHCIIIFVLTYGFMGLEEVAIELDDPFGDDDNDFDVLAYAQICFEDTYMLIHDTDGQEWADKLRKRMNEYHGIANVGGLLLNISTSADSHESTPLIDVPPTIHEQA